MSQKTTMAVLTALFPKSFNRESIGTVTRLVTILERLRNGEWFGSKVVFARMKRNHYVHVSGLAVKSGYVKVTWDPQDRRRRLYRITKKGERFLARIEKLSNGA